MRKKGILTWVIILLIFACMGCAGVGQQKEEISTPKPGTELVTESKEAVAGEADRLGQEEINTIKGIVQVQTDSQRGSGVLWDKQDSFWCFVTAAHVVEGLKLAEIYFEEFDKLCVADVYCVEGLDLAFLQVDTDALTEDMEAVYESWKPVAGDVSSGDSVWTVGYSASAEMLRFGGTVWEPWIYTEDFENYMLLCQCEAQPGMSGGAVVTLDEALAGIICGQNEEGMLAGVPIAVIEAQYDLFINY